MLRLNILALPTFADVLEGENGFCVLLGLTLLGVLAGWAYLFVLPPRGRVPTDAGLALVAIPALYLSIVIGLPAAERLVLVMPALPVFVAGITRAYFRSRTSP